MFPYHQSKIDFDSLTNEKILELFEAQMPKQEQEELSDLLEINRERIMSSNERKRLDELMQIYGQGMVRKAEATKEAVRRGLIPPLNS
jgi:hypothetical protein